MDSITMQDLKFLSTCDSKNCVSLFMPTHRARPQSEQNPIRLKNLLRLAEERLEERGLSKKVIEPLMEAPRRLLGDFSFWERQSDGLAVFFSRDILKTYRLPLAFPELVVVADNFHIKPLRTWVSLVNTASPKRSSSVESPSGKANSSIS